MPVQYGFLPNSPHLFVSVLLLGIVDCRGAEGASVSSRVHADMTGLSVALSSLRDDVSQVMDGTSHAVSDAERRFDDKLTTLRDQLSADVSRFRFLVL